MRSRRAAAVGVLCALLLAGVAPASDATPLVDHFSYLHVEPLAGSPGALPQILDQANRPVLLRGINVNGLEDYYSDSATPTRTVYPGDAAGYVNGRCPARDRSVESVPVCDFDAAQIKRFGYNVVRLAVSWSLLEPTPGKIDYGHIERIAQVVDWLAGQGIYSIIDMHQDAWSKFLFTAPGENCPPPLSPVNGSHEADGAPAWASTHVTPVCKAGPREVNAAVQEDFQRLWSNVAGPDGVGLQDHYAGVVLALAHRFAAQPAVAGYDIMNEPSPGFLPPQSAVASEILPFYAKVIKIVRDGLPGFHQLFWIEPDVTRDVTDQRYTLAPWSSFSDYANVVYAPHIYTHVFTPDAAANAPGLGPLFPVASGYASAADDARALGVAFVDGEFGIEVAADEPTLREHYDNQDALGVGGALWVWKADGSAENGGFSAMQGPFGPGTPFPSRVKFSDRAYPIYTAGTLAAISYDPDRARFELKASSKPVAFGDRQHAALIYVPAAAREEIAATGADIEVISLAGGAREVYAYPRGGVYRIFQGNLKAPPSRGADGGAPPAARAPAKAGRGAAAFAVCASHRRLVIHLRVRRGTHLRAARAYRGGKLIAKLRAHTRTLTIDLRGAARARLSIRIVEFLQSALGPRRITFARRFRTCQRGIRRR